MGVVSIIIRLVLNLAVGAGSVMILYGIVSSRVELPKHSYGADGTCLLWTSKSADGDKLITGPAAMCNFAIAFASVSILLAILLTIIFLRSIATGTADKHTILVIMGLVFLICSLIMALAASIVISVGVLISCRNIKDLTTVPWDPG